MLAMHSMLHATLTIRRSAIQEVGQTGTKLNIDVYSLILGSRGSLQISESMIPSVLYRDQRSCFRNGLNPPAPKSAFAVDKYFWGVVSRRVEKHFWRTEPMCPACNAEVLLHPPLSRAIIGDD